MGISVPVAQNRVGIASVTDAKLATPDMSGVGQGLARGLEAVGQGASKLDDYLIEHKQQLDDTAAKMIDADAMRGLLDKEQGYRALTGTQATNGLDDYLKGLDEFQRETVARATSPRQQQIIAPIIAARVASARASAMAYARGEGVKANDEATAAHLDMSANMARAATDDHTFFANADTGAATIHDDWIKKGFDPAVAADHAEKWRSSLLAERATHLTETGQIDAARAFYQQHKAEFVGDDGAKLEAMWQPIIERRAALADVDAMQGAPTPEGAAPNFVDPLRGTGRPPVPGGQYGAGRDYGHHEGVDTPAPKGSPIYSGHGPGIARVTQSRLGGNIVTITHDDGYVTKYDHLGAVKIVNGQQVDSNTILGTVGMTGRSTGPHLHYEVIGPDGKHLDPSHIAAQVTQGPARADLGGMLAALDKRTDLTPEQREQRRQILLERVGVSDHIRERNYADADQQAAAAIAKIGPDNFTSITQLPASVRSALKPTDYLRYQTAAQSRADENERRDASLNLYRAMSGTPGATWNRYDPDHRKAVDAAVDAAGGSPAAALMVWQKTGILPTKGEVFMRGGLVSTDPTAVQAVINVAGNMVRHDPNAFAGVTGGEDMERAATAFNHYVYDLGMDPGAAAARIAHENTPAFREHVKLGQPEIDAYRKQLRQTGGDDAGRALGGQFAGPAQAQEANQAFADLTIQNMQGGHDLTTAQAMAKQQLQRVYGMNRGGRLIKYAPEIAYPALNGSHDYVYQDAARSVSAWAHTKVDPNHVFLVPIPGVTDEDMRQGRPARYRVYYSHLQNGQVVHDLVPHDFVVDMHAATAAASRANEAKLRDRQRFNASLVDAQARAAEVGMVAD